MKAFIKNTISFFVSCLVFGTLFIVIKAFILKTRMEMNINVYIVTGIGLLIFIFVDYVVQIHKKNKIKN